MFVIVYTITQFSCNLIIFSFDQFKIKSRKRPANSNNHAITVRSVLLGVSFKTYPRKRLVSSMQDTMQPWVTGTGNMGDNVDKKGKKQNTTFLPSKWDYVPPFLMTI